MVGSKVTCISSIAIEVSHPSSIFIFLTFILYPKVHQVDRFGPLISKWENKMRKQGWPYNKEKEGITKKATQE